MPAPTPTRPAGRSRRSPAAAGWGTGSAAGDAPHPAAAPPPPPLPPRRPPPPRQCPSHTRCPSRCQWGPPPGAASAPRRVGHVPPERAARRRGRPAPSHSPTAAGCTGALRKMRCARRGTREAAAPCVWRGGGGRMGGGGERHQQAGGGGAGRRRPETMFCGKAICRVCLSSCDSHRSLLSSALRMAPRGSLGNSNRDAIPARPLQSACIHSAAGQRAGL